MNLTADYIYISVTLTLIYIYITDEAEDIKLSSSPRPNSEFMRQPPDGAEKIKIIDEL